MIAWLPVAALAACKVILRLISLVASVWQERVHARSNCVQMSTAAVSNVVVFEHRHDGTTLLIIPVSALSQGQENQGQASAAAHIKPCVQGMPPS